MANKRTSVMNEERRRSIIDFVNQNGRALVRDLAKKYSSSEITIRRDLEMLHNRGLLYRTHGGALPIRAGTENRTAILPNVRCSIRERSSASPPPPQSW